MARKKPKPPSKKNFVTNETDKVDPDRAKVGIEGPSSNAESIETLEEKISEDVSAGEEVVVDARQGEEDASGPIRGENVEIADSGEKDDLIHKLQAENDSLQKRLKEAEEAQARLLTTLEEKDAELDRLQEKLMERIKIDEERKEGAVFGLERQRESMNRLQERLAQLKKEQEEAEKVKKEAWTELRKRVQAVVDSVCQPIH